MFKIFDGKKKRDKRIQELREYIQNYNFLVEAGISPETIDQMADDEVWEGYGLVIDIDRVSQKILENGVEPISIIAANIKPFLRCEDRVISLTYTGKSLELSEKMKKLLKKRAENPVIIAVYDLLPVMVINGNHRVDTAIKSGQEMVEGYLVQLEDYADCLIPECIPVYEAYCELYELLRRQGAA